MIPLTPFLSALTACYRWSLTRPQAIGYGVLLVIAAQFRIGDAMLLAAGLVAIVGGLLGAWRYVLMKDEQSHE